MATGWLAFPWAAITGGFALFTTAALLLAIYLRLQPDWDPDEGLPSWPTIAFIAIFPIMLWTATFEAWAAVDAGLK